VWFGTEGSGLLAYANNRWYQFTTRDGLPCNRIGRCALDSKDNLWILTSNGIAMRKSGGLLPAQAGRDFINPGNKRKIKQSGNRFYLSSDDSPKRIQYTLFDLRGRTVLEKTIQGVKSFELPENRLGPGVGILLITSEHRDESRNSYFFKINNIR
jgi:ligand-binding sensor domain-containing protein